MSYPTLPQSYNSSRTPMTSTKVDIAINGMVRARSFYTATTYNIQVVHENVSSAEMQSVIDCYTSVISSTLSLTWDGDGDAYTVIFNAEPTVNPIPGGMWNVESKFVGRRT
jgi:hypothetical protein